MRPLTPQRRDRGPLYPEDKAAALVGVSGGGDAFGHAVVGVGDLDPYEAGVAVVRQAQGENRCTRPCMTALEASSATTRVTLSEASDPYGTPQASSWCVVSNRASRAPRRVAEKRWGERTYGDGCLGRGLSYDQRGARLT